MTPDEIRALRKSLGLTQRQFGAALGVGIQAVFLWERGERNPSKTALLLMETLSKRDHPIDKNESDSSI